MSSEGLAVKTACRLLGVTRAGFYAWKTRPLSPRAIRQAMLTDLIRDIHATSRGTYGAPRVHAELRIGREIIVSRHLVARLMRQAGLVGLPLRRRFRRRPGETITSADLVDRQFARHGPDQLWVTDITEHHTREGKVYCAVVLDTFSRRVVGWAIDSSPNSALATNALSMAIENRSPQSDSGLVIHSDQARSSPLGPSPDGPGSRDCCHRWAVSVIASITR
jgi:transposase InsO family protein